MGFSGAVVSIDLENDHLIMQGNADESPGCVLRGVLNVQLRQPIKVKSILLTFTGTLQISWAQPLGNGHERYFRDERTVVSHQWFFLRPQYARNHLLATGTHSYEFDLPLAGDLPESVRVAQFYAVQYNLKALIQRPHFYPNYTCQRSVHVTRHLAHAIDQAVSVANQWTNKVDYEITVPTKLYQHGQLISITLCIKSLLPGLCVRQLTCTFKEYATCKPVNGWFGGRSRSHGKILYYIRTSQSKSQAKEPWHVQLAVPVPDSLDEIQYDTQSEAIRIRHKLKFILTIENPDGHLSELRAVLPVIIHAKSNGLLPTYDQSYDSRQTFPYDPTLMVALVRQQQQGGIHPQLTSSLDHDIQQQRGTTRRFALHRMSLPLPSMAHSPPPLSRLPTYDELQCH